MLLKYMLAFMMFNQEIKAEAKEDKCPYALTDKQIKELQSSPKITLDGITFRVDGGSLLLLSRLKAEDFANEKPFIQVHGRTLNCWLKLKGTNKYFGLRQN